jgi:hypothetical protein
MGHKKPAPKDRPDNKKKNDNKPATKFELDQTDAQVRI